jgi:glutathione S-transferase
MNALPPTRPIRLHTFALSGHGHRAELFLSLLGLPFERVDVDLVHGAQKRPEFLALNLFGKVPVIEDDGAVIADSHAILVYLALRYDPAGRWLPREPLAAAQVQRWFALSAGPLVNGAASARWATLTGKGATPDMLETAQLLLRQMEQHLAGRDCLAGACRGAARLHRPAARRGAAGRPACGAGLRSARWNNPSTPARRRCRNVPACARRSRRPAAA